MPGEGEQVREQAAGLRGTGARWDKTKWEGAWRRRALEWSATRSPKTAARRGRRFTPDLSGDRRQIQVGSVVLAKSPEYWEECSKLRATGSVHGP